MRKQTKIKRIVVGCTAAGMITAAVGVWQNPSSLAYLTDHGELVNQFRQGKMDIVPKEPDWPGNQESTTPGDIIPKNPMVEAEKGSEVPAYVYLQVKTPFGDVTKVNDDGSLYDKDSNGKRTKRLHQLITFGAGEPVKSITEGKEAFLTGASYRADTLSAALDANGHGLAVHTGTGADQWTLLSAAVTGAAQGDPKTVGGYVVYTYAYNNMLADTTLSGLKEKYKDQISKGILTNKTTALFDKIRMINCVEGQLDNTNLQVPVKAFAIQSPHTGSTGTDDTNDIPASTAEIIKGAANAFEKYAGQNADNGKANAAPDSFE